MMKWPSLVVIATVFVLFTNCLPAVHASNSYADQTKALLQLAFKGDFSDWTFRENPVGAFGVGTIYDDESSIPLNDRWLLGIPSTWYKDGLDTTTIADWNRRIIVAGDFGSVALTANETKKLSASLILSSILSLIGINLSASRDKSLKVTLSTDMAVNNRLDWTALQDAIKAGVIQPSVVQIIQSGHFVICAADIELNGYTLSVDSSKDSAVNAQLQAQARLNNAIGNQSSVTWSLTNTGSGTYVIKATTPVVAAVLFKAPPGAIGLNTVPVPASGDLGDWNSVDLSHLLEQTSTAWSKAPSDHR